MKRICEDKKKQHGNWNKGRYKRMNGRLQDMHKKKGKRGMQRECEGKFIE